MSNVNDVRIKRVPIVLGGKDRTIKFDLNSFAELEEKYGSIDAAMDELEKGSIKAVRLILWAGLIHEEMLLDANKAPTGVYAISPFQVGGWVGLGDLKDISGKLKEAMETAMPAEEEPTAEELVKRLELVKDTVSPNA